MPDKMQTPDGWKVVRLGECGGGPKGIVFSAGIGKVAA